MITFKQFVDYIVETYGVLSYLDNEDDLAEGSMWVQCPECEEPILEEDWTKNEIMGNGHFICPICGYDEEDEY